MTKDHVVSAAVRVHLADRVLGIPDISNVTLPESGVHQGAEYTRRDLEKAAELVGFPANLLDEWEKTEQVFADRSPEDCDATIEDVRFRMDRLAAVINGSIAQGN